MIPEHFLEQKRAEIQAQAELQRAGMEYIVNFVNGHEEEIRRFYQLEGEVSPSTLQTIYRGVQGALEHTANHALSTIGIQGRIGKPGDVPNELVYQLGFLQLSSLSGTDTNKKVILTPIVTEYGIEMVDGFRAARGEKSLQEERAARRETRQQGRK